jgi:hypothetical protein
VWIGNGVGSRLSNVFAVAISISAGSDSVADPQHVYSESEALGPTDSVPRRNANPIAVTIANPDTKSSPTTGNSNSGAVSDLRPDSSTAQSDVESDPGPSSAYADHRTSDDPSSRSRSLRGPI